MTRLALMISATLLANAALADEHLEEACVYQAKVVSAIQLARLKRVPERSVSEHILATDSDWPEQYNVAIPLIAPWVYEQKRRVIRKKDLSAVWAELCLQQ